MDPEKLVGLLLTALILVMFLMLFYITYVRAVEFWYVRHPRFGMHDRIRPVRPRYA